ncbi:hypothetical protein E2C01_021637 [Portunus trituberculatus]|uniref:Uncharacterized protein n=1 Tax=Portunus trituberculatus TaxID=210409 RepID=A0A5B7E328_PORTR|nr:hypothetical protein [Portunus trituberculatus]
MGHKDGVQRNCPPYSNAKARGASRTSSPKPTLVTERESSDLNEKESLSQTIRITFLTSVFVLRKKSHGIVRKENQYL